MKHARSMVPWSTSLFLFAGAACDRPVKSNSSGAVAPSAASTEPASSTAAASPPTPVGSAPASSSPPAAAKPGAVVSFDSESVGAPSPSFEAVVGDWYVAKEAGAQGLKVDGGRWRNGTPSANLADQAKRLYGDRYAEFLDGVKAFAFFPLAVWKAELPPSDFTISVRFYPLAGKVDQAAGIAFAVAPDGSYLGVRANALEDNILYFRVVKGKRTVLDNIRNVPTPSKTWHTLVVNLRGTKLVAMLDGQKRLEKTLDRVPTGKVGLWSKADSQVLFDDFEVEPISGAAP